MPTLAPATRVLRFDTFELDLRAGELRKRGVKLRLQGQPVQLLAILLQSSGNLVTREELRSQLWPADTFVDFDHILHNAIARIREVLGDSAETPRYIETVPRRGYRFIAPVESQASALPGSNVIPAATSSSGATPAGNQVVSRVYGRRAKVLALTFAVAIALLVGLSLSSVRERLLGRPSPPPRIESLAVLPLANLS